MRRIKALEGKTVEIIENNGTDICIYFTDGSFLGINVYGKSLNVVIAGED